MLMSKEQTVPVVDDALDTARKTLGLNTDEELADNIGVSSKTISFWRNGRWTKADIALIRILVSALSTSTIK